MANIYIGVSKVPTFFSRRFVDIEPVARPNVVLRSDIRNELFYALAKE